MSKKLGGIGLNGIQLEWIIDTHGNWKKEVLGVVLELIAKHPCQSTQGLIKTMGSMVIFDENQGVSNLSKFEFLCPIC